MILGVLCAALCAIVIDNTILSIAIPSIGEQLDADETDLQWITTSYGLVLSGLLLPLAVLGDRYGRRRLLVIGLVIFGVSSAAAAFATTPVALILCRGAMGAGGACAMPATLAIIGNVFAARDRGRAISVWSGVAGFAAAAGPLIGGLLLTQFWWGSVFLVNVPVVIVGVVAAIVLVPESSDPAAPAIDWPGAGLWTFALVGLLFGIIEGPERGWTDTTVLVPIAVAAALLVAFARREQRAPAPLISPASARHRGMRAGAAIIPTTFFAVFGSQFVLTQWLQGPRGLGTLAAASCFLPNAAFSVLGSLANPRLVRRGGHALAITAGAVTMTLGLVGLAAGIGGDTLAVVVVAFGVVGLGQGFLIPSGVELIMTSTPAEQAGSAAGVNETIVEAGGALGVAVVGSILVATSSYAWPIPVAAAVVAAAAVASVRLQRGAEPQTVH
jgi:MFS family permease